ncbi:hypothetical protein [Leptospira tipperaryensis]|uniref:hypothetical protein n=1 Tax=Leptospira tipperaryensis TaxID=2564040 RepID=UPI0012EAC6EC|nr:hypothetical protein [Leptospira tipperaryensis]
MEEPPIPVSIGSHSTTMQTFDTRTYNNACIVVSSYRVLDGVGGFSDNHIFKKIIVP